MNLRFCLRAAFLGLFLIWNAQAEQGVAKAPATLDASCNLYLEDLPVGEMINSVISRQGISQRKTVILAPSVVHPQFSDWPHVEAVMNSSQTLVSHLVSRMQEHDFEMIVAAGGCTTLDVGRAVKRTFHDMGRDTNLILSPTMLSTPCLANEKAVIDNTLQRMSEPNDVVISLHAIRNVAPLETARWTSSGWLDYFANLSAAIEQLWRDHKLSIESLQGWRSLAFQQFFQIGNSSLNDIVDDGHLKLAAQSFFTESRESRKIVGPRGVDEHKFYYRLIDRYPTLLNHPYSHGEIVAFGNLMVFRAFAELTGIDSLYRQWQTMMSNFHLSDSLTAIESRGLRYSEIRATLMDLIGDPQQTGFLISYLRTQNLDEFLRRTFAP